MCPRGGKYGDADEAAFFKGENDDIKINPAP